MNIQFDSLDEHMRKTYENSLGYASFCYTEAATGVGHSFRKAFPWVEQFMEYLLKKLVKIIVKK